MSITYDQARQLGKRYVGALNTGPDAFAALFVPGAEVRVAGEPAGLGRVLEVAPPGRSAFRGARVEPPHVLLTVRVRDHEGAWDLVHRLLVGADGRITALEA